MIKKLMMLCVVAIAAMGAFAATETVNGITWTYTVSGGKAEIYSGRSWTPAISSSTKGAITIPSTLGGYLVTSIGEYAFYYCSGLTSVTIPDSVTSIGYCAFYNCKGLTSVTIPDGVTSIGEEAFWECSSLTSVTIPNSVTSIGEAAFSCCSSLTSVTIPNSVTRIGNWAFEDCSNLTSVTIPDSVTSIGEYAFSDCSSLTSVTIPDSVTSIGEAAFYCCSSLASITIGSGVTSIGGGAFSGCSSLASVTIPDSVTSIGDWAFEGCNSSLYDTTTIPGVWLVDGWAVDYDESCPGDLDLTGVRGIAWGAFSDCRSLTSVTIPDSVTSIGDWAFFGCSSLTSVTIPNSVTSIGEYAFSYCSSLASVTIPDSVTSIGEYAFSDCSSLTSVTIPDSVTSIGGGAFSGCSSLASITIGSGVTSIGGRAFCGCEGLADEQGFVIIRNVLYYYCGDNDVVTIPNSVTSIGEYAFEDCSSLASITIPDSVTSIGGFAFWWCESLTSVTIPDSVTSIGDWAFEECSSLASVTISDHVRNIGYGAFGYCDNLRTAYLPSALKGVVAANNVFEGCSTNLRIIYSDSLFAVSVVVADGCEEMGKVTGGKTAKAGTKLTLKATPNKGYVFSHWDGSLDESQDSRNPSISYVVGEDDAEFVAYFIPVSDDWVDVWLEMDSEYATGEEISDIYVEVESGSLATLKVKGLPSGLKYTAKAIYDRDGELLHDANTIYGTPKKSGVYTVEVTATTASKKTSTSSAAIVVRKENEKMVKLSVEEYWNENDEKIVPGKVSGGGIFAEGKKVSLKATANKGFVFAGWWDVNADEWFYGPEDYRNPKLSYVMTDSDVELMAVFMPAADDWVEVWLDMAEEYTTGEEIDDIYVEVDSGSLATLKFKGLPSGLKYTAKAIYDRSGNLLHEANTIYGTPKKSGVYTVTVTATTASKKTSTSSAVIVVRKENEKMVKLAVQDWYDEDTGTTIVPGKVSGGGIFAEGKKLSLKATANKGFVFAGWWDVNAGTWLDSAEDYRNPKLSYVMTDSDMDLEAVFMPLSEDNLLDLYIDGYPISANASDNVFDADGECKVKLEIDSLSLPKASVSGLPKGLKFDAKTNMITGVPTAPGFYIVTVKLTNQSIKKAIEKKFTISVSNLTGANDYFVDGLYNGVGEKYSLSVGISNIEEFLPSLELNAGTLAVSGLPSGLKYDAKIGKIFGIATKAGTYTVTLTVTDGKAKYVSTITIEVEALPDWVVGTFETYHYIIGESTQSYYTWDFNRHCTLTINANGRFSGKGESAEGSGIVQNGTLITKDDDGSYLFYLRNEMSNEWNYWDFTIRREVIDGVVCGVITGRDYGEDEADAPGDLGDPYDGDIWGIQNTWKIAKNSKLAPNFVSNTITLVDMSNMEDRYFDGWLGGGYPYGGYLTLKYGANGAVTTAYSETEGGNATATGSAQLVPYEVDGNITKAWLYAALKPKGRDSFGVLLFLSIDTSNGNIYGDDVVVDDYLLEVEE